MASTWCIIGRAIGLFESVCSTCFKVVWLESCGLFRVGEFAVSCERSSTWLSFTPLKFTAVELPRSECVSADILLWGITLRGLLFQQPPYSLRSLRGHLRPSLHRRSEVFTRELIPASADGAALQPASSRFFDGHHYLVRCYCIILI